MKEKKNIYIAKVIEAMTSERKQYVYGIAGLMRLLKCDEDTAINYVRSGKMAAAINYVKSVMVVDVAEALRLCK